MPHFYFSLGTFGVMEFLGDIWPGLIANVHCYPVLGCNTGFAGYDGLVHLVSGVCIGLGLLWFRRREAGQFALWGLAIPLVWEACEWGYDAFRTNILHMNLLSPENIMTQPTNIDTAGDIMLGCLGTALVYLAYSWRRHHE